MAVNVLCILISIKANTSFIMMLQDCTCLLHMQMETDRIKYVVLSVSFEKKLNPVLSFNKCRWKDFVYHFRIFLFGIAEKNL